jgi:uncharacterized coiled-coil protein SlyX
MKNYFLIGTILFFVTACSNQSEVDKANRERDSLAAIVNQRDSSLNEFMTSYNEVERNLDSIAVRQNIVTKSTENAGEFKATSKDRINAQIAAINNLMEENRKKLATLNAKLKSSNGKNAQLQKMIQTLNEQLAQKDKELAELNEKLAGLNAQVTLLQTSVDTLNQTVSVRTTALHTAYYVIGKEKDLEAAKIIDRSGGVLGLGKTDKLSTTFDNSKFTRVDYTQMGSIPIESKKVKIVTTHPAGSYSLDKDGKDMVKSILITDPEKFWSASKYLVVVKD